MNLAESFVASSQAQMTVTQVKVLDSVSVLSIANKMYLILEIPALFTSVPFHDEWIARTRQRYQNLITIDMLD